MSDKKSGVEKVINSLSDFENELEEIKNKSEMKKTEIINMANSEVEKIQNDVIKNAIDTKNKNVSENIKKDKANTKRLFWLANFRNPAG